jgi:pimeloyl-ACP methyl ester carboxylesterase
MDQIFTLADGRQLGYCLYGQPDSQPCLYFHGTPSSRLEPQLLGAYDLDLNLLLYKANFYFIAIDRPGMGFSTFNPKGDFVSFSADVQQLLQHLQIVRCPVLTWSGGGPYALAIAHQYPQLISSVSIICGFTRPFASDVLQQMGMNRWYFRLAKYTPWLLEKSMNVIRKQQVRSTPPQWISGLPYVDYAYLKDPRHMQVLSRLTLKEACRNGAQGAVHEARTYFNDFGFSLSAIQQPIHYWWGLEDMTVIRLHAEAIEQQVLNAVMHYREKEGHVSLYVNAFEEILQGLSRLQKRK